MRTGIWIICFLFTFAASNWSDAQELLSEEAFVEKVLEEFRSKAPGQKVRIAGELHLEIETSDGEEIQVFLHNAYKSYRAYPDTRDEIIEIYTSAWTSPAVASEHEFDAARIVPVVKDAYFIAGLRQSVLSRRANLDDWEEPAHEALNRELMIVYAEDSETTMRFISEQDLEALGFDATNRLERAVKNLKALLPPLEAQGGAGIYLLSAGGDYETSLLLFDSLWESGQLEVKGEIVAAVPARGLLIVTGSEDAQGLQSMKAIVAEASAVEAYPLTDRLFVYRDGRFVVFE